MISEAVGQLPLGLRIPPEMLEFDSNQAVAGSSVYDIFQGTFLTQAVAIKKARTFACVKGLVEVCTLFLSMLTFSECGIIAI